MNNKSYMAIVYILALITTLFGCGSVSQKGPSEYDKLNSRIGGLQAISDTLTAMISSDYATCPASGDTADALIRKICNVAQAATNEAKVELKGQLSMFNQQLQGQINAISAQLVTQSASIDSINTQLTTINSTLTTLDGRMTSAEGAITALQALTASISGVLAGNMLTVDIGTENVSAGPLYETVLRRVDKKKFAGYVYALGTSQAFASNPFTAVNGSANVTVALTAHGYVTGDIVLIQGLSGSRGFSNAQVYGEFVVGTTTANTFVITLSGGTASSSGTLGGSAGLVQKVVGRGMGTLWASGNVSDVAVRLTNLGSKRYNFIIRRIASDVSNNTAELCYDKTNNAATFATINAAAEGGAGNIVCK